MAKWALVLTVGTTAEPLKKAIKEVKTEAEKEGASLVVLLFYGRPFRDQTPDPFQIASEVYSHAKDLGISAQPCEMSQPEDLDVCLKEMTESLQDLVGFDRIIINYTGGTKAMSAAVVHAALTMPFVGDLELHYVGGTVRDKNGRVIKEAMEIRRASQTATQERMKRVLDLLSGHRYELASYIAEDLPAQGRAGFLRGVAKVFHLWDNFNYEDAQKGLWQLKQQADALANDPQLGTLAGTVQKLVTQVVNPIVETIKAFRNWEQGNQVSVSPEGIQLLCADILENANRRLQRREWTEAVLRSYRALEAAVQGALVLSSINPWRFDVSQSQLSEVQRQAVQEQLGFSPKELTLHSGIVIWQIVSGKQLDEEQKKKLQDIQQTRNRSMLEHGFRSCERGDAEHCLEYAKELASWILESDLTPLFKKVQLAS